MKNVWGLVLVSVLSAVLGIRLGKQVSQAPRLTAENVRTEFFRIYHSKGIQRNTQWLGVPIQQTPTDMWMVQQIVTELRPDFIIETGTLKGGSSLYYASVLSALNASAKIITVDIEDQLAGAKDYAVFGQKVIPIVANSVAPETVQQISRLVQGRPALVLLDSDHHKEHVLKEMRLYAQFVPVGGYMIVFDTDLNGHPVLKSFGPGPMEAVEEFLRRDDRFVSDPAREKFMLTMCANGYLKRVK